MKKYQFIDALRGIAFLAVLVYHAAPRVPGLNGVIRQLVANGFEGVQLFFLVSAMTLFLSLDGGRPAERLPLLSFYLRRFFRIVPLFYLGMLFYAWWAEKSGPRTVRGVLCTLSFTNAWSSYWINRLVPGGWSIAIEMNFYLIVPFLFRRLRGAVDAAWMAFATLIGGGLASVLVRAALPRLMGQDRGEEIKLFCYYWLPNQLPIFALGFFLFFIVRPVLKGEERNPTLQGRGFARLLMGTSLYLIVALSFSQSSLFLGHALFGVAFVLLAWSLAVHPTVLIVNPIVCYIGTVSFSAYLSHFAVLDVVEPFVRRFEITSPEVNYALFVGFSLAGTVLISTLTYRLIEVPGQAVGRFLIRKLQAIGQPASTQPSQM